MVEIQKNYAIAFFSLGNVHNDLKEFEDADLSDEDIRIKIAKKFVDDYDAQIMSPIGM